MLSTWSRRLSLICVIICIVGWVALATAYGLLAILNHATLPAPYNVLIALFLAMLTLLAVAGLYVERILAAGRETARLLDERDARLYALLAGIYKRLGGGLDADTDGVPTPAVRRLARVAGSSTWDPRVVELGSRVLRSMERTDD